TKPSDSRLTAGLNGLNWQVQVWPCSLEMVTVPPCLWLAWSAPPVGLDVVFVLFDWQAARIMHSVMRTATVLERLILTVPSSFVPVCRDPGAAAIALALPPVVC